MSRFYPFVLTVALLLAFPLLAQTPDTVTLQGTVTDPSRASVAQVEVTVKNETTGLVRSAVSDATGHFALAGLPIEGAYSISVSKSGFASIETAHLHFTGGSSAVVAFVLKVAGQMSTVTVEGSAGDTRVDEPQLGVFLSEEQMQETPLPSRRITYLPLLEAANRPAISQGDIFMNEDLFNTNGAGRRQTWFEADGANAVDMWGRQTIFSNIPLMAVDEMTVLTNAFSAEYGAGTGSVVDIITRCGGDRYHGQLLELGGPQIRKRRSRDSRLATRPAGTRLRATCSASRRLHCPVRSVFGQDSLLSAGEWNREAKASPVTSPLAPGSFVGHYRGWLGFLRLDRQIDAANNAFLRMNFDNFTDTNPNGIVGGSSLPSVDAHLSSPHLHSRS